MHEYASSAAPAVPPPGPHATAAADADAQLPWYALRKNKKALATTC